VQRRLLRRWTLNGKALERASRRYEISWLNPGLCSRPRPSPPRFFTCALQTLPQRRFGSFVSYSVAERMSSQGCGSIPKLERKGTLPPARTSGRLRPQLANRGCRAPNCPEDRFLRLVWENYGAGSRFEQDAIGHYFSPQWVKEYVEVTGKEPKVLRKVIRALATFLKRGMKPRPD